MVLCKTRRGSEEAVGAASATTLSGKGSREHSRDLLVSLDEVSDGLVELLEGALGDGLGLGKEAGGERHGISVGATEPPRESRPKGTHHVGDLDGL
jgi:hypothetical protein